MSGVSVDGFERGEVLSPDFGGVFGETACHSTKKLIGSQVRDIIGVRVEANLCDRLHWCGLLGVGRSM